MYEKILEYVELQKKITTEFKRLNANCLDFSYLLDFPKKGKFCLNSEEWSFVKHGSGFRFIRIAPLPRIIIHPHVFPFSYKIVDAWRLLQFWQSQTGDIYDEHVIKAQLETLFLDKMLEKINLNQYQIKN